MIYSFYFIYKFVNNLYLIIIQISYIKITFAFCNEYTNDLVSLIFKQLCWLSCFKYSSDIKKNILSLIRQVN